MLTKNFVYGARSPDIEQAVGDAIYAAHRYRNQLCELELAKRQRHEDLLQRLAPEYVAACQAVEAVEQQLGEAREAIQAERKRQRTRKPKGVDQHIEAARSAKSQLKDLRAARKAAKHAAYEDPAVDAAIKENQQRHKAAQQEAKRESGLYWGTEAVVKASASSFSSGAPPRFKRWDGEGQLAVQLQQGLDTRDAIQGDDTRLQLRISDELQEALAVDGKARQSVSRQAEALVRIGSDGRAPVFARVPITVHRPLPPGKIKWAYLERRMLANEPKWSLRLTIDTPSRSPSADSGTVAVHVGWLMEEQGLRVASWRDDAGQWGYLRLPHLHCDDHLEIDEIRSERDRAFNEYRDGLRDWLRNRGKLPEWLREAQKTMHLWRSPRRLAGLVLHWRDNRFVGDEIFLSLDKWRKRDKKHWQHERRLSKRLVRRRRDTFRNFAAELERRCKVAVIAPIDAKELVEHSDPEALERDDAIRTRHAKWAAVSDLLRIIREKFHLRCVEIEAAGITQECASCGEKNTVRRRKVQCDGCCRTYDVDENALENTLARGEAAIKNGALLELQRAEEVKADKQREKLAKLQRANRAARKKQREAVA